jgi:hypothetical protein
MRVFLADDSGVKAEVIAFALVPEGLAFGVKGPGGIVNYILTSAACEEEGLHFELEDGSLVSFDDAVKMLTKKVKE